MPHRSAQFDITPIRAVSGVLGSIAFDATTTRNRNRQGQVITHAKEASADGLTDDVILDQIVLQVTAHFVDFPMYAEGYEGRSSALVAGVRALQESKIPSTVIAGDDIYTSMVVAVVGEPRDSQTGDGVDVDLTLSQVEVGDLVLVDAVPDAQTQALGDIDAVDIGWLP